jgi:hypothetical protein
MMQKKMSLANIQGKLSRAEMKSIMAGSGACQSYGEACNSATALNCCTGLVCADFKCRHKTL